MLLGVILSVFIAHLYQNNNRFDVDRIAFSKFQNKYGKLYSNTSEEMYRFQIFSENKYYIDHHQNDDYVLKINQFGDLTPDEIDDTLMTNFEPKRSCKDNCFQCDEDSCYIHENDNLTTLPDSVDWRLRGMVSPIKNQGRCGSCWAFAAAGALESAWAIRKKRLADISTQQMVDCDKISHGCNGGRMDLAYSYLIDNGVVLEENYPYQGVDGACRENLTLSNINITAYGYVAENRPLAMKRAVSIQPISIAVAVGRDFAFYSSGIFNGPCSDRLNHAVILTGYGVEPQHYWTMRNSWGEGWGELGYMRLKRTEKSWSQETCGLAAFGVFPLVGK